MKKLQLSVLSPFEQLLYLYVSTFSFENFLYLASLGDEGTISKAVRKSSLGGGPWLLAYCFVSGGFSVFRRCCHFDVVDLSPVMTVTPSSPCDVFHLLFPFVIFPFQHLDCLWQISDGAEIRSVTFILSALFGPSNHDASISHRCLPIRSWTSKLPGGRQCQSNLGRLLREATQCRHP